MMHKPVSLAEQVYERLEEDILSGKYPRGTVLTELKLSEDLGVSRTPIREALRMLEQDNIVVSSGKGVTVLSITPQDADTIYCIRERIEGLAAAECAKNITSEELNALSDILNLQEFYATKHDAERVQALDGEFHELIYRASRSSVLYHTLRPLHKKIQKYRKNAIEFPTLRSASIAEHRAVFDAIAAHDPEAADRAITAHIQAAHRRLSEVAAKEENK